MIPDDPEERKRLLEWIWRDLVAEWHQCDHAKARGHCVNEPSVKRFEAMAERVLRSVDRYEVGLPFPQPLKNVRVVIYQDENGKTPPPPPPKVVADEGEPVEGDSGDLFH